MPLLFGSYDADIQMTGMPWVAINAYSGKEKGPFTPYEFQRGRWYMVHHQHLFVDAGVGAKVCMDKYCVEITHCGPNIKGYVPPGLQ